MLAQIIKPAIELARNGFVVTDDMADTLLDMYSRMSRWPNSAKSFSRSDGTPLHDGDRRSTPTCGNADGYRRTGSARFQPGPGRRETGERGQIGRRHHDR